MNEKNQEKYQILEELRIINRKVEELQNQLSSQQETSRDSKASVDELTTKFLFEEYKILYDTWKHVDSRLGSTLSLYLTISGAVVPAVAFLTKDSKDINLFLITLSLAALVLAIAGMFVARRITTTGIVKAEYFYAISLIRGFFVDHDTAIAPYLFLPFVNEPIKLTETKRNIFRSSTTNRFIIITHIWIGALFGFAISTISRLIFPSVSLLAIIVMGVMIAGVLSYWLEITNQKQAKRRISMLWNRRQSLLSSLTLGKASSIQLEDHEH